MTTTIEGTTATKTNVRGLTPEDVLEHGDRHMETIIRTLSHRVVFTLPGRMRLASVCGWLRGLSDSGSLYQAYEMADNFCQRLNGLVWGYNVAREVAASGVYAKTDVDLPANKVVLSDDGCHHSFSFAIYTPLSDGAIMRFEMMRRKFLDEGRSWTNARRDAYVAENCLHEVIEGEYGSQLTEERYLPCRSYRQEFPYTYSHNGGLIFHSSRSNPTGGEWSTHT